MIGHLGLRMAREANGNGHGTVTGNQPYRPMTIGQAESLREQFEAKARAQYPRAVGKDRDDVIAKIKADLRRRSGKSWSVKGGRGTSWGWIHISPLPGQLKFQRDGVTPCVGGARSGCHASKDVRRQLGELLCEEWTTRYAPGDEPATPPDEYSIPPQSDYREEYLQRAEGVCPPLISGKPDWD